MRNLSPNGRCGVLGQASAKPDCAGGNADGADREKFASIKL
jgi:hypothetical protein